MIEIRSFPAPFHPIRLDFDPVQLDSVTVVRSRTPDSAGHLISCARVHTGQSGERSTQGPVKPITPPLKAQTPTEPS